MLKRTIPLLFAVAVALIGAVPAEASHCVRCTFYVDYSVCRWGTNIGRTDCDDSTGVCETFGDPCNHLSASALTPLSSEFQVASVERIDEEAPAPNEALVAKLDAPKPAAESTR
jgi:hypothetical protein